MDNLMQYIWYTNDAGLPSPLPMDRDALIRRNVQIGIAMGWTFPPEHLALLQQMSQLDLLNLTADNERMLLRIEERRPDPSLIGAN